LLQDLRQTSKRHTPSGWELLDWATVFDVAVVLGVVCAKDGFGWTRVDDSGSAEDHSIKVPGAITDRARQLRWLHDEAVRIFEQEKLTAICIQAAGTGRFSASVERIEIGAVVQAAAGHADTAVRMLNREQVRSTLGVPRGKGAYEELLQRQDVQARSNPTKRDQYLLGLAGLV